MSAGVLLRCWGEVEWGVGDGGRGAGVYPG